MLLNALLAQAHSKLVPVLKQEPAMVVDTAAPKCVIFFSIGNSQERAHVHIVHGNDLDEAWRAGELLLARWLDERRIEVMWLRVDVVNDIRAMTWAALGELLSRTKRNYFRFGLSFTADFSTALLEQEIAANALLYDNTVAAAKPNANNLRHYGERRFGIKLEWPAKAESPIWRFKTRAVFTDGKEAHLIEHAGPNRGYRVVPNWGAGQVHDVIGTTTAYLARQVKDSGQYHYGWFPCFDRAIPTYNALRHASSTYALLEGWELTEDDDHERAIRLALSYLTRILIKQVTLPDGKEAAFLVDTGDEIKLGGNAVCVLALTKYTELTGDGRYLELAEQLAVGILHMQNKTTGAFTHVLNYPDLSLKAIHRIIYYDGEAAFGLMRLYGLTKDERWLQAVVQAFDHFIEARHWKAHDHWLSYCVNELTLYRPELRYYEFGLNNVRDHLDFVKNRITTFPTLLELMMAAQKMITRIQDSPESKHVLEGFDLEKFYLALETRARYLLSGFFWPELAMFFKTPGRILDSFFIRHHAFRVRIDDVEHYLSGYVAYWAYLVGRSTTGVSLRDSKRSSTRDAGAGRCEKEDESSSKVDGRPLTAAWLERVTGGRWVVAPDADWQASGVCVATSFFQPGNLLVARGDASSKGLPLPAVTSLALQGASGILCEDPCPFAKIRLPLLQVPNRMRAILAMGRHARTSFTGCSIGVTGSAGKTTTVAMAAHVLRAYGKVGETVGGANLPIGVAWNMASLPQDAFCWVLELAIGQMPVNTDIARPDVAVVTNVAPAHLEYHGTTETIAIKKARIFDGMPLGGVAIISRDILHFDIFSSAVEQRALKLLTFGRHEEADVRLIDTRDGLVRAKYGDEVLEFALGVQGEHMAMNALAVICILMAQALPWKAALPNFRTFEPVAGRGAVHRVMAFGQRFAVIDEAYNANPLSMTAALAAMADSAVPSAHRVLVLGEMLELGPAAPHYHEQLDVHVARTRPDRILLCGDLMKNLWTSLAPAIESGVFQGEWFQNAEALKAALPAWLKDGDVVLFKGSHSTGLHRVVSELTKG